MRIVLKPWIRRTGTALLGSDLFVWRKLAAIRDCGVLTVLNLHRVDDDPCSAYQALAPALFDDLLGWLKTRFELTTFQDLQTEKAYRRPPLVLSFDDGYRDFIRIAAPILEKHRIRVNHNIIPACVETGRPPINVEIQDFIGSAPAQLLREVRLPGLPQGADPHNRVASALLASASIKQRRLTEQKKILDGLRPQFLRFDGFRTTPVMSLDEVRQVAAIHELGAHSFEHATMTAETDEYLAADLARCKTWFSVHLNRTPNVYAFPNGAARPDQPYKVRSAGFPIVLAVGERFSRPSNWHHPRFTFYAESSSEARFRALGGLVTPSMDR